MDRDQLIDLTRRTVKLARDKTTDLAPSEHTVAADSYTSYERHKQDTAMLMASPQLVGYVSELPRRQIRRCSPMRTTRCGSRARRSSVRC
jgi:hypothetical protein